MSTIHIHTHMHIHNTGMGTISVSEKVPKVSRVEEWNRREKVFFRITTDVYLYIYIYTANRCSELVGTIKLPSALSTCMAAGCALSDLFSFLTSRFQTPRLFCRTFFEKVCLLVRTFLRREAHHPSQIASE